MKLEIDDLFYISDIVQTDGPAYVHHLQDKQIYDQTLNIPYPYTAEDAKLWIQHVQDETFKQGQSVNWAIRSADGNLIGGIGFHGFTLGISHQAELGYWLARPYWGQGIMTKAVNAVCSFAFKEFKIVRITAHIFYSNIGSSRVLEKCGFHLEGILRKYYMKDGKIFDSKLYAKIVE